MMKNLGYDGVYHDENISVSVLLENPKDFRLESSSLVFSVTVKSKLGDTPTMDDVTFYVMDEADYLYNTHKITDKIISTEHEPYDDEPAHLPDGLICTDFKYEFLFQDLRIAFYVRGCNKINIVKLEL